MSTQFEIKKGDFGFQLFYQLPLEHTNNKTIWEKVRTNFHSPLEAKIHASIIAAEKYKEGEVIAKFAI